MGKIRLLLALSVIAAHCGAIGWFRLLPGQDAVQAFYIISGFYMSLVLNEKYIGKNDSYKLFITNRFLRLAPIYWAVLLISVLICLAAIVISKGAKHPIFSFYFSVTPDVFSFAYLILANILIFGQDVAVFLGINPSNGHLFFTSHFLDSTPPLFCFFFIPQAWTLGLELTFYLVAPFVLKKGVKLILIVMGLSLLLRLFIYNYWGLHNDPWTYRFFPTEIMYFLFGYFSFCIYRRIKDKSIHLYQSRLIYYSLLAFTLAYSFLPNLNIHFTSFTCKALLYDTVLLLSIPFLFKYFKGNKIDNKTGELSYPVYISHVLIAMVLTAMSTHFFYLKSGLAIALISVIFSWLLVRYIAAPVERYRQSRVKRNVL